jgi:hypothetical protein
MNAKTKKVIDEMKETNPSLSPAALEKLISDLAARKPVVKADRRFRIELKAKILGRKRILRFILRPQIIGAAAAAVAAVVIGSFALSGLGTRDRGILAMRSIKPQGATSDTEIAMNDTTMFGETIAIPEKMDEFRGSGFNPEGPSEVDGRAAPAYKERGIGADTGRSGYVDQSKVKLYFGYLSLTVKEPEKTREQITAFAEKLGGYVETAGADLVVIRVPQAAFTAALKEISSYGEVTDKSIETYDVSAEYQDLTCA